MPLGSRVLVFPAYQDNPILRLMQATPQDLGFEFVPARKLDVLYAKGETLRRGDVFHLHWTAPIAQAAADEDAAATSVATFARFVEELAARGVRTIWTVHNRLPHELHFLEPELELCRFLTERIDVIHVMSEQTADVVADLYPLPAERVRVFPLSSYEGMYEGRGPAAARDRFELGPDEPTVLFFGRMRAYKGLDTLCDAVRLITQGGRKAPTLMLAGPAKDDQRAEVERQLPTDSRVIAEFGYVDESEVRDWFDVADVAVFPFRAILNSSSVKLSATLGVPAILPGLPHLRREFADEPWVRFFDLDDPAASLADLLIAGDPGDHRAAMEAYTRRSSPQIVSRAYADLLLELTA